jgi:cytochrome P450
MDAMPPRTYTFEELLADPDARLKSAREQGPIVDGQLCPIVVRHAEVRELGQSEKVRPAFSSMLQQLGIHSGPFYEWMARSPLDMEGAEHRVWRSLMSRTFTPRSVETLRPKLKAEAERLAAEMLPLGECDFIERFARQLPSFGLCELIGVPTADRARFTHWADTIGMGFNVMLLPTRIGEVDEALVSLLDYAGELVEARRAEPRDDLVTRIAQAADETEGFDEERVRASVAGLVFAGHETTKNQLGWMIAVLAEAPEEWRRCCASAPRPPASAARCCRTSRSVGAHYRRARW